MILVNSKLNIYYFFLSRSKNIHFNEKEIKL